MGSLSEKEYRTEREPDRAGGMMDGDFVTVREEMTVEEAFRAIRASGAQTDAVYTCYVLANGAPIGAVEVKRLLFADRTECISDLMEREVLTVDEDSDREEVAGLFERSGVLSLPVLSGGRMVGVITAAAAREAMREETEEDFERMTAITPRDRTYFGISAWRDYRSRIPWLLLLMFSATFTGMIISGFESALSVSVYLTAFIPMLMGTAGNAGSQASVTVIRALSLGEVGRGDLFRILKKEARVALLSALTLAVTAYLKLYLVDYVLFGTLSAEGVRYAPTVVALTLFVTVIAAKLMGALLPVASKRLGFDPAVMASPFITTAVDTAALIFYFRIAQAVIPGM